ncbi:MAG: metallophosphoesterase [Candidatus Marsarchaeota archaeon]|nr:metallophosphoesterase [Candidatus Marsarchaeota archaeon]
MQEGKALVSKLYEQLEGKVMIAAELTDSDIGSASIDDLSAKVLAFFEGYNGLKILDKRTLDEIQMHTEVKEPIEVVVARQDSFNPESKNFESDYRIRDMRVERTGATVNDFAAYFRDRYRRLRDILSGGNIGMVISTDRIGQYAIGREVSIVGMVYDKAITKKGNLMVTLEDEFGTAKIIFVRPSGPGRSPTSILFESAMKLVTDEVIAVRGKMGTPPLVIATQLIWPDVPVRVRKQTREDMAIALTSDVHVGSRFFIEGMFIKFIEWLNGNVDRGRGLAGKVKYVIIGGDVADGIGVYPGQDRELSISDVYKQYSAFMNYIEDIPEYIEVFVIPGNHDAVQLR